MGMPVAGSFPGGRGQAEAGMPKEMCLVLCSPKLAGERAYSEEGTGGLDRKIGPPLRRH